MISDIWDGAPEEIRTPDPQIRSLQVWDNKALRRGPFGPRRKAVAVPLPYMRASETVLE
jgi:hypothetical protein